jgi:hypothetical protein
VPRDDRRTEEPQQSRVGKIITSSWNDDGRNSSKDLQPLSVPKFPKLKKLSLEDRNVGATEYVNDLVALPKSMDATSHHGQGAVATRCYCLHRHIENDPRFAGRVGIGVANFTAKP